MNTTTIDEEYWVGPWCYEEVRQGQTTLVIGFDEAVKVATKMIRKFGEEGEVDIEQTTTGKAHTVRVQTIKTYTFEEVFSS